MEDSILLSTKNMLGIENSVFVFDNEIATQINSAFSILYQFGIGDGSLFIDIDNEELWSDLALLAPLLNMIKTFVFLKVKINFDPPATSFLLTAAEKQIEEHTYRLLNFVELNFS